MQENETANFLEPSLRAEMVIEMVNTCQHQQIEQINLHIESLGGIDIEIYWIMLHDILWECIYYIYNSGDSSQIAPPGASCNRILPAMGSYVLLRVR